MDKICTKCKEVKLKSEFHKDSSKIDKLYPSCKICVYEYNKNNKEKVSICAKLYRENNKEKLNQNKKIYRKLNVKKTQETYKLWSLKNKEKRIVYMNKYRQDNKEKLKESRLNYLEKNPEQALKFKIARNLRTRISYAFKSKKFIKETETIKMLGCDFDFLMNHIECLFVNGMNWDNYGIKGWHLDHIIPISSGKNYKEMCDLNHYTNLQPLWAIDNIKKGNKIL